MNENEARQILARHSMERGMDDRRSCIEIVEHYGFAPKVEPVETITVTDTALLEAFIQQVPLRERRPYFAR